MDGIYPLLLLTIDKIIFFNRIIDLTCHVLYCLFRCCISIQHIFDLCLNNLTGFREYTKECPCGFRCGIMQLIQSYLELRILSNVVFKSLLFLC